MEALRIDSAQIRNDGIEERKQRAVDEALHQLLETLDSTPKASTTTKAAAKPSPKWKRNSVLTCRKLTDRHKCKKCKKSFNQASSLKTHETQQSCKSDNACEWCGRFFTFHMRLVQHQKSKACTRKPKTEDDKAKKSEKIKTGSVQKYLIHDII